MLTVGQTFTFKATVRNLGTGTSSSSSLQYYRSSNSVITLFDNQENDALVSELSPSASVSVSVTLTVPEISGTYYYGACVDGVSGESNINNNCSSGVKVEVVDIDLDLEVQVSDKVLVNGSLVDTVYTDETFQILVEVVNFANTPSPSRTLRYYLSSNSIISRSDTEVGTEQTKEGTGIVFNEYKLLNCTRISRYLLLRRLRRSGHWRETNRKQLFGRQAYQCGRR